MLNKELDDGDHVDGEEVLEEHNQPDFDKRSVISNKTIKSLVAKKKDKIKLKRQFLLKRKLRNPSKKAFCWSNLR